MLHLYYFESLLEQHGIFYGYKFVPRMVGIQVGYNKNYYGISIAIPRYIAMQLSTIPFIIMTRIIFVILPCMIM